MLKFFRNIRKRLLREGKTASYLKYALGEILLVMIGILLALQVNNWNENRKNNRLKDSYVENLMVDLNKDIANLENLITLNTTLNDEGRYLAQFMDNTLKDIDTLKLTYSIVSVGFIPNSTIIASTYNDLISSNNIHLFNDVELKRLLDDYYIRDAWVALFNDRILKTAWYDYRDEMLKYHSPLLYQDYYAADSSIVVNYSWKYNVAWESIRNNEYLKKQVGMIGAYRAPIRNDLETHIQKAKKILSYLDNLN